MLTHLILFLLMLFDSFLLPGINCERVPSEVTILNHTMLQTWYDRTQICMMEDRTHTKNATWWVYLSDCRATVTKLPPMNDTTPASISPSGFTVLPSSAFSKKSRDGCCNSDVQIRDRGFDWVFPGFEDGRKQRQCIDLLQLLSKRNMSLVFIGDSMNNQVTSAFIEECIREGIDGAFNSGAKDSMPWFQHPDHFGIPLAALGLIKNVIRMDWSNQLRKSSQIYNNSVYIYVIDLWYGRRSLLNERHLMELALPTIIEAHPSGLVILTNVGHHLESERSHSNPSVMVSAIGEFLNWLHEYTKMNSGLNLVLFRETTPSHFDSPALDGSYEKWKGAGRSHYDYMARNPWDDMASVSPLYHCRAIKDSAAPLMNTLENLVAASVIQAWNRFSRSHLGILHVFKYLAPFYRLKYGFCGGYDRLPVLDCVHYCAWSPPMWVPVWQELLDAVKNWVTRNEHGDSNYKPLFGKFILNDMLILSVNDSTGNVNELYLYYHGVRRFVSDIRILEQELDILRNASDFPRLINITTNEIAMFPLGTPMEAAPTIHDGAAIASHGNLQIWYFKNGTRHSIPNWDTFCSLGFNKGSVLHFSEAILERIRVADPVPAHDWPTTC